MLDSKFSWEFMLDNIQEIFQGYVVALLNEVENIVSYSRYNVGIGRVSMWNWINCVSF